MNTPHTLDELRERDPGGNTRGSGSHLQKHAMWDMFISSAIQINFQDSQIFYENFGIV
jgi:hypothetical protein